MAGPALAALRVARQYPGVRAVDDVTVEFRPGSVHALLGENGAGKSTLVRMLTGQEPPDAGVVTAGSHRTPVTGLRQARRLGIALVPQDVLVVPGLTVGRYLLLGEDPPIGRRALSGRDRTRARDALRRAGVDADPDARLDALATSEQRLVQIARALASDPRVLVLDEPTAVLSDADAATLLAQLDRLRAAGRTVVYISHRLGEVLAVCDTATVLRNGRVADTVDVAAATRDDLVALMLGARPAPADARPPRRADPTLPPALRVDSLTSGRVQGLTLTVPAGGIVGLAGVQGSGLEEALAAIAGTAPATGAVAVAGRPAADGPRRRYAAGIALVPADRRGAGVIARRSIRDNIALPVRSRSRRRGMRLRAAETRVAADYCRRLALRAPAVTALAGQLSGGNQQKLAIARALEARPAVLLVGEPTQGVDVGAKAEIRAELAALARDHGVAVLVAASDFEELEGLADTVHVLREGRQVAELTGDQITYQNILHFALG